MMAGPAPTECRRPRIGTSISTDLSRAKQSDKRKTHLGSSDKISGFHPLRSLRNIFFGYRHKESQKDPVVPKAKSTDDLLDPTSIKSNTKVPDHRLTLATTNLNKQLSISADNLLSPSIWRPAPHGIASVAEENVGITDNASEKSPDNNDEFLIKPESLESLEEFFLEKWTSVTLKHRSYSSGDADLTDHEAFQDLDAVRCLGSLDVKSAKDRIAVKPKGKRISANMQIKVKNSPLPNFCDGKSLFCVDEEDEEICQESESTSSTKLKSANYVVIDGEGEAVKCPVVKKTSLIMNNELLAGALKKIHKNKDSQESIQSPCDKLQKSDKINVPDGTLNTSEDGQSSSQKKIADQNTQTQKLKKTPPVVPNKDQKIPPHVQAKEPKEKDKIPEQSTSSNVSATSIVKQTGKVTSPLKFDDQRIPPLKIKSDDKLSIPLKPVNRVPSPSKLDDNVTSHLKHDDKVTSPLKPDATSPSKLEPDTSLTSPSKMKPDIKMTLPMKVKPDADNNPNLISETKKVKTEVQSEKKLKTQDETVKSGIKEEELIPTKNHSENKILSPAEKKFNVRPITMFHDSSATGKGTNSNSELEWLMLARKKKKVPTATLR